MWFKFGSQARRWRSQAAQQLGLALARQKLELVYGGGRIGLMGQLARTVLEAGGEVIGVIPRRLVERELAFTQVSDLRIVGSMHERKALMADLADSFIALPGGLGTIEEMFEALTWAQLGMHGKPCGLMDVAGYYRRLVSFIDHAMEEQFIEPEHRAMLLIDADPERLLQRFQEYQPPTVDKAKWALSRGAI